MCENCDWWQRVGAFAVDINFPGEYVVLGVLEGGGYGIISEHSEPESAVQEAMAWAVENDMECTIAEGVKVCRKIDQRNFALNRVAQYLDEQHGKHDK